MNTGQVGGRIGPFIDPATNQQVSGRVWGTFTFQASMDPNTAMQTVQSVLPGAVNAVLQQKLAAGQVALPTMQTSLPHFYAEIIAETGAAQHGVQITGLELTVSIETPAPVQPHVGPLPPDPMQATANAFAQAAQDELDPRNYEWEARVNVGGFKVKASTDGGLDTDGLAEQAKDKAKSTLVWWGIGCAIVGLVIVGLLGLGWYIYGEYRASTGGPKPATGKAKTAKWDGKKPFSCGGSDHVKLSGVTAKLGSGTAVTAGANCRLELVNVNITAPTGISALSNAVVTVNGGSVTGKTFAAKALGNAQITFKGTKVKGKTQALGSAKITGP
jgi:hypothetical protein